MKYVELHFGSFRVLFSDTNLGYPKFTPKEVKMQTEDPLITCPYDLSHAILKSRMQSHLVKCKQNHPLADKMICPFNAIHHIDKPHFQYHVSSCPDRRVIEGHKYELEDAVHGDMGLAPYHQPELPPAEEDWDAETPVTAYNPSHHVESAPVVRLLMGATKSQRKAFRLRERQRMQRLLDGEESASSSTSTSDSQPGPSTAEADNVTPLRAPRGPSKALQLLDSAMGQPAQNSETDSYMDVQAPLRAPQETPRALRLLDPRMGLGRGIGVATQDKTPCPHPHSNSCELGFGRGAATRDELSIPIGIGRGKAVTN